MQIKNVEILHIEMPLNFSFKTAKTLLNKRESLIIRITDCDDVVAFGEVVAFTEPFYTTETLDLALDNLIHNLIPQLLKSDLNHPFDIHTNFLPSMALAGLENALLDLYAKKRNINLVEMIFNQKINTFIELGLVFGDLPYLELEEKVAKYYADGCKRFKFKIFPSSDSNESSIETPAETSLLKLKKIRNKFPEIQMLADANRSFVIDNSEHIIELKQYDNLNLLCIEEAFDMPRISIYSDDDFRAYKDVIKLIKTKICFDESLLTIDDMQKAYEQGILQMINIKIGRLGGLYYVKKVIDFCREKNIDFWVGSMLESGVSKILHVQLAALNDVCMAGDLSDSLRYFQSDIIKPNIFSENGKIFVPSSHGIGVEVDEEMLAKYTRQKYVIQ